MKKITNLLVAISFLFSITAANAGSLNVTGNMETTYNTSNGTTTGNPIGMDRELKFSGTTELDSGITVSVFQDTSDSLGYGNSQISFGNIMGLATIYIGSDADPVDGIDDITPSAYEEANGSGSGTYIDIGSMAGDMGIGTKVALPYGVSLDAKYYPKVGQGTKSSDNSNSGDGTVAADANNEDGVSAKIVADLSEVGLAGAKITAGYATSGFANSTHTSTSESTVALNYAAGPLSVGAQFKHNIPGGTVSTGNKYRDNAFGIAYAVNDALSLSVNRTTSTRYSMIGEVGNGKNQETDAINIGYTIGGMTIGFQDASTDNANYVLDAKDDSRTLGVSVAF